METTSDGNHVPLDLDQLLEIVRRLTGEPVAKTNLIR